MQPRSPDDHAAFLRLYAENEGALQTFIRSLVSSREEVTEILQEVLVVLWEKYDQVEEFRPWSFGVARNMVLRHLRAKRQDRHVFSDELVQQLADKALSSTERHAVQRDALERCLDKLPAAHRHLVLTAYAKGTRIDDLARRLGRTPMSLYKLLHRIRQALLECVQRATATGGPS